jgi:DNA-binding NtrC family response regulator
MEDIPALVNYFIEEKAKELGIPGPPKLVPGTMNTLQAYAWPGNVRELENVVERALILQRAGPLTFNDIVRSEDVEEDVELKTQKDGFLSLDIVMSGHIKQALKLTNGKIHGPSGAASLLGLNPSTLRHRMRKLGLTRGRRKNEQDPV